MGKHVRKINLLAFKSIYQYVDFSSESESWKMSFSEYSEIGYHLCDILKEGGVKKTFHR